MDAYPKSPADWRFEVLHSGMYAQVLVLWPLLILGGLFMIYNTVAWWRFRILSSKVGCVMIMAARGWHQDLSISVSTPPPQNPHNDTHGLTDC